MPPLPTVHQGWKTPGARAPSPCTTPVLTVTSDTRRSLCSWLPEELAKRIPARSEPTDRPVLVMHGTRDSMIDVERARESRRRLIERNVPLTYREYEMGHEIARDALIDLHAWIDDKVFAPVRLL